MLRLDIGWRAALFLALTGLLVVALGGPVRVPAQKMTGSMG